MGSQAKVDIFSEGLLDDAIQAVRPTVTTTSSWCIVASSGVYPSRLVEGLSKAAELIMEQGKADRYQEAVQWLRQVKLRMSNREQAVWTTYFNQLQSIHARKRKLMDLFKQLQDDMMAKVLPKKCRRCAMLSINGVFATPDSTI